MVLCALIGSMRRLIVLINSKSRQGSSLLEKLGPLFQENHLSIVNDLKKTEMDTCTETIVHYAPQADAVLVAGGDGSVNAALPGLIKTQLPLLVVPMGTANNLAATLQLPKEINDCLSLLKEGRVKKVDVGMVNDIPFINLVGLGISTRVNTQVNPQLKRWIGPFAFVITCFQVVRSMKPFSVRITWDNQVHIARSWQVTVCNGRHYGNGLVVHEDASLTDRKLHILSTEVSHWWKALFLIPSFIRGKFADQDPVQQFEASTVNIETKHRKRVDIDGDIKAETPLEIRVLPKALSIIVPGGNTSS